MNLYSISHFDGYPRPPMGPSRRGLARTLIGAGWGLGLTWAVGAHAGLMETASPVRALTGTEAYCSGYETTFHGEWRDESGKELASPVLFRIGVNDNRRGCYAQLNILRPSGIAPYELPRFRATVEHDGSRTLRYQDRVLEIDPREGTAVSSKGKSVFRVGVLLDRPPEVEEIPPPPPARQRERWYGKWRGRFPGLPARVTLRFSPAGADRVMGRASMLLLRESFIGYFHGDMLIFQWRNRHVGLLMEPDGDEFVYTDYKWRVFRFRRRG